MTYSATYFLNIEGLYIYYTVIPEIWTFISSKLATFPVIIFSSTVYQSTIKPVSAQPFVSVLYLSQWSALTVFNRSTYCTASTQSLKSRIGMEISKMIVQVCVHYSFFVELQISFSVVFISGLMVQALALDWRIRKSVPQINYWLDHAQNWRRVSL